jgi:hypothetical protein
MVQTGSFLILPLCYCPMCPIQWDRVQLNWTWFFSREGATWGLGRGGEGGEGGGGGGTRVSAAAGGGGWVQGFISYTKTPSAPAMRRWRARSHTQYTVSVSQTQTRYNSRSSQQMYVARACTPFPWRCEAGRAGARTPRAVMRGRPVAAPGVSVAVLERQLTWGAHPRGAHAVPLPCPYHGERETSARPQGSLKVATGSHHRFARPAHWSMPMSPSVRASSEAAERLSGSPAG